MTVTIINWADVQSRLVRSGWVVGWGTGIVLAIASVVAGRSPDLSVMRALAALMSLVLLGYCTAQALARVAPPMIIRQPKGTLVDAVVGDETGPATPESEAGTEGEPEADAEPQPEGEISTRAA